MPGRKTVFLASALCLFGMAAAGAQEDAPAKAPPLTQMPAEAQKHIDAASLIADKDGYTDVVGQLFNNIRSQGYITPTLLPPAPVISHPAHKGLMLLLPPAKIFDQVYYFGNILVGTFALTTPDGIILFDTMSNDWMAEHIVEAGFKAEGLDPKKIKYIVLTHGHSDHAGGVRYFQRKYPGIHVVSADWDLMARTPTPKPVDTNTAGPVPTFNPKLDIAATDGQKITLGGTTLSLYILPGHTPHALSIMFPVTDHGTRHMAALWGGLALSPYLKPNARESGLDASDSSLARYIKLNDAAGVDVILNVHTAFTDGYEQFERLAMRGVNDPNPFVLGKARVADLEKIIQEVSVAYRIIMVDAEKKAAAK